MYRVQYRASQKLKAIETKVLITSGNFLSDEHKNLGRKCVPPWKNVMLLNLTEDVPLIEKVYF